MISGFNVRMAAVIFVAVFVGVVGVVWPSRRGRAVGVPCVCARYGQFSNVTIRYGGAPYGFGGAVGAGATGSVEILVRAGTGQDITFSPGSTLDIKLHTAAGKEYPRLIELTWARA